MLAIKQSRVASFVTIALLYVLGAVIGIATYKLLPFHFAFNLLIADICVTIFIFIFSLIFNNASVYDPYWSVQPIIIVVALAIDSSLTVGRLLILLAVCLWGIRLTTNWAYTFKGLLYQDWRYTELHDKTKQLYPIVNFIGIHLIPTLVVYGCILPAVYLFNFDTPFNAGSIIGFVVSVVAFSVQGIADIQMHRYRLHRQLGKTNQAFMRTGLWKYSRHPNYLCEIIMWYGVAISVVSVLPQYPLLLIGAVANTVLFLCISIPLADGRQSRKQGYDDYRSQTRMLLPIKKPLFK
ncbi:MAG: DUF1295 domain-containing protein [Clostridia bacterium]|nr:DUF1295 domain-containing protein [Clostridia bacterium]